MQSYFIYPIDYLYQRKVSMESSLYKTFIFHKQPNKYQNMSQASTYIPNALTL